MPRQVGTSSNSMRREELDPPPSRRTTELNKLDRQPAERAEIRMQRVALLCEHDARERARKHDLAGLEGVPVRADLISEPGDAERGMPEHAGGKPGLLDLGIA